MLFFIPFFRASFKKFYLFIVYEYVSINKFGCFLNKLKIVNIVILITFTNSIMAVYFYQSLELHDLWNFIVKNSLSLYEQKAISCFDFKSMYLISEESIPIKVELNCEFCLCWIKYA